MGEYERTYKQIDELKKRKIELIEYVDKLYAELYAIDIEIGECEGCIRELELKKRKIELIEYINGLYEELYAIDIKIGECEGYIKELEYIDGEDY